MAVVDPHPIWRAANPFAPRPGEAGIARRWRELDGFELLVLAVFAAVSMWVIALDLWQAAAHGLAWTGIDGEFPVDQMQYLAWVQDASRHVLVSDLFGAHATPHDYLQPMIAISGGLTALGVAPWLSLLVWKPIAIAAVFLAVLGICRRALATRSEQRAALVLALFAACYGTLGDEWLPFISWGYAFALMAVAAMVGALLAYDRARRERRLSLLAPTLGLLACWLHPWQGELLILIIVVGELAAAWPVRRRAARRSVALAATTATATALPLLYYVLLERLDAAWRLADTVTRHHAWALSSALLPLLPLLLAAALAYRRRPRNFLGVAARLWPFAALGVWALSMARLGATPLHAWTGITIPLAVLAVEGVRSLSFGRLGNRWLAVIVVAALTVPGTIWMMSQTNEFIAPGRHSQNLITRSELRAFRYLASNPRPGGVLSSYTLGDAVPGETGRRSYLGDYRWSGTAYETNQVLIWEVLHGWIRSRAARAFVLGTGMRFLLTDCTSHAPLQRTLAPILASAHSFGCATVYDVS